jgi:hypothetical protein
MSIGASGQIRQGFRPVATCNKTVLLEGNIMGQDFRLNIWQIIYIEFTTVTEYSEGETVFISRIPIIWCHPATCFLNLKLFIFPSNYVLIRAMPWLTQLITVPSLWMRRLICVGFEVDKVALGQVFLKVLQFSPDSIIPPWLSILIYNQGMKNRPISGHSPVTPSYPINMNNMFCYINNPQGQGMFFTYALCGLDYIY